MRSKNILSIVAFVTAFAFSAAFAGLFISRPADTADYGLASVSTYTPKSYCNLKRRSQAAQAITTLIAADNANGLARGSEMYDIGESYPPAYGSVAFADYAESVESYVDASSDLATGNLPSDFKSAWRRHLKAWRDYSNFLNKAADISRRDALTENEFNDAEQIFGDEINRTWSKVLQIGESYGADVR